MAEQSSPPSVRHTIKPSEVAELEILAMVVAEPIPDSDGYRVRVLGWGPLADLNVEFPTQRDAMTFAVDLSARYGFHLLIALRKRQ